MKGYLKPTSEGSGSVSIESRTEIYRDPDAGQEIVVEREGTVSSLEVADVTVSRKQGDSAPVVLVPESECIEVRNQGNSNGVVVDETDDGEIELAEGRSKRVRRDAEIKLGFNATFRLTVEREAREEYVFEGEVHGGEVVMGDKDDNSTVVEDVVAKDLNVESGGEGSTEVRDAVANEMNVGDAGRSGGSTDTAQESTPGERSNSGPQPNTVAADTSTTQNVCERHQITYTGTVCPECAEGRQRSPEGDQGGTKYCMFCGEEIPERARVCPACGEDLSEG